MIENQWRKVNLESVWKLGAAVEIIFMLMILLQTKPKLRETVHIYRWNNSSSIIRGLFENMFVCSACVYVYAT
jgi:predicted membrane protein